MTNILVKLFIKNSDNISDSQVRERYGILSSITGIVCNIILFIIKFILGAISHSIAITGDAFNNLSDVGSFVITFLGFKMASRPADEDHPFGHGRIEYISGLIITILIFIVGLEILKTSVSKIINPEPINFSIVTIIALLASILLKFWISGFNRKLGKKINSQTMMASAADSLNDCISTGATTIGVIASKFIPFSIDGYLGVMVGAFILYSGYGIAKETLNPLLGKTPDEDIVKEVKNIIMSYELITGVHDLVIHDYGPGRVMGSAHAEVPYDTDIVKAHDIIDNAELEIKSKLNMPFVIHFDPVDTKNEHVQQLKVKIEEIIADINEGLSIHDFRVVSGETHTNIIFDIVVPYSCKYKNNELKNIIDEKVKAIGENYRTVIYYDRSYI